MSACAARQEADGGMRCAACALQWDRDDSDPPACPRGPKAAAQSPLWIAPVDEVWVPPVAPATVTTSVGLPVVLPLDLERRMIAAYERERNTGDFGQREGMRAAWRVLLDEVGG